MSGRPIPAWQSVMMARPVAAPSGATDPDVTAWAAAVETADGQALESTVIDAVDVMVAALKSAGVWPKLAGFGVFAGNRSIDGCFVPLVGGPLVPLVAPHGFATFDRALGLTGNSSENTTLHQNFFPPVEWRNDHHLMVRLTAYGYLANRLLIGQSANKDSISVSANIVNDAFPGQLTAFSYSDTFVYFQQTAHSVIIVSRTSSAEVVTRVNGNDTTTANVTEHDPSAERAVCLFGRYSGGGAQSNSTLAAWGYGTGLDAAERAAYDTAVTGYVDTIAGLDLT